MLTLKHNREIVRKQVNKPVTLMSTHKTQLLCKMSTNQFNAKSKSISRDAFGDQRSLVLECTIRPAHRITADEVTGMQEIKILLL